MIAYISRRISVLIVILFGSSFILYNLSAIAGDPIGDLRFSDDPQVQAEVAELESPEILILALPVCALQFQQRLPQLCRSRFDWSYSQQFLQLWLVLLLEFSQPFASTHALITQ
jgi:hypothetical protein